MRFRGCILLALTMLACSTRPLLAQTYDPSARANNNNDETKAIGSPYVELDSWIYPALIRLAALGHITTRSPTKAILLATGLEEKA